MTRYLSLPLRPKYGGTGIDAGSATGSVVFYNGTAAFDSGTIHVDALGADPTGTLDASPYWQAAIDGNYRRVIANPNGTYLFNTAVTIPSLPDGNTLTTGREIDGQGCRIVGANSIVNCFQITDAVYPNNQRHLKFHDFVFDGTVSGAFVLHTANASWYNQYHHLRVTPAAAATTLLEIRNTSAATNPGMFTIHHLVGEHQFHSTLLFSMGVGALGQFDNFHIYNIAGGAYEEHASAVQVDTGCALVHTHIHDVLSIGPHGINAEGGYIQKSRIERIYVEVPGTTVGAPTAYANNWAVAGQLQDCEIDTVWGFISNATDHPGMIMVYATGFRVTVRNFGVYCAADYDAVTNPRAFPYIGRVYPVLYITGGEDITFDFPQDHVEYGTQLGNVPNVTYLGGRIETYLTTTGTCSPHLLHDGLITNFGQGVGDVTITLPVATEGRSVRFVMVGDNGGDYHIKPNAANKIVLDGTPLDDGDKITCASPTLGNVVYLYTCRTSAVPFIWSYSWIAVTEGGTWTDGGA